VPHFQWGEWSSEAFWHWCKDSAVTVPLEHKSGWKLQRRSCKVYLELLLFTTLHAWMDIYLDCACCNAHSKASLFIFWLMKRNWLKCMFRGAQRGWVMSSGITIFFYVIQKIMYMTAVRDIAPCSLVKVDRRFIGTYCLHYQAVKVKQFHNTPMEAQGGEDV
jgi:hypothetical protein